MSKKKSKSQLLKKILLDSTKGMKKLIKEQEEIIAGDIHDLETKVGCNYTIGYATGIHQYRKDWLELLSMSKKEILAYIERNKQIGKQNKKYLNGIFEGIMSKVDGAKMTNICYDDMMNSTLQQKKSSAVEEIATALGYKHIDISLSQDMIPMSNDMVHFCTTHSARHLLSSCVLLNYNEDALRRFSADELKAMVVWLCSLNMTSSNVENITLFIKFLPSELRDIYLKFVMGSKTDSDLQVIEPYLTFLKHFSEDLQRILNEKREKAENS